MVDVQAVVVAYLTRYGQPQTYEAVRAAVQATGADVDRGDLDLWAAAGLFVLADGGVNALGQPVTLYAPLAADA